MGKPYQFGRKFEYKYSHFGTNTNGHDVKAFGDTSGKYFMWDASADTLYVVGTLSLDGTFNADNIALIDAETLTFGTGSDVVMQWDGTNFIVAAAADDSLIEIGDSAVTQKSFDLKWYGNEASGASYLYADASANLIYTVGVDVQFKDNDYLVFGTGAGATGDVNIVWDATNLIISAVADDTLIEIGDSAATQLSFDLKWYGNGANGIDYLYFDASANLIYTTGIDMQFNDNDKVVFGTGSGASGDVGVYWDATDLVFLPTAASANTFFGGSANLMNIYQYGDVVGRNVEADATGYTITASKSRAAANTALQDNDVVFQITGQGYNDNATPVLKTLANLKMLMTDASDTTEDGAIIFETMVAGAAAAEKLRIADVITATAGLVVGVDATGYDVQFFGDTTGCSMLWDQSEDQLVITGPADVPGIKLAGAGTFSPAEYATAGTAWADGGTPAFAADQKYLIVDYAGTLYRLPVWANA